jgi:hypothetical protein
VCKKEKKCMMNRFFTWSIFRLGETTFSSLLKKDEAARSMEKLSLSATASESAKSKVSVA